MDEKGNLTPEEKVKVKRILKGVVIFAGAYLGAKCGAKAALKDLKIDLTLISDGAKDKVVKLK